MTEKGLGAEQVKALSEKLKAHLKEHPGADAKIIYPEKITVILNSGTDRKKVIEGGDITNNGNSENRL